jgi:hypothetical protein
MALGGYPLLRFMFLDTQVAYRAVSVRVYSTALSG